MEKLKIFLFFILINLCCGKLNEIYRWKQIAYENLPENVITETNPNFSFPDDAKPEELTAHNLSTYIPYNNVPFGLAHHKGRLFIAVPRRRFGVPSTLNVIDISKINATKTMSPRLRSYPDYETNSVPENLQPNPDRIISVYRPRVDLCERLWFIDTGMMEIPGMRVQIQRPAIWIIDLKTNKRIRRYEIPEKMAQHGNGIVSLTIDVEPGKCDDAYAYLPDLVNRALSVYSLRENKSWTFYHNYFSFDPINSDFDIGGVKFQWDDGIFSVTLGPKNADGYRTAFFLPMASISLFSVSTEILKNESLASRSYHGSDFKFLGYRGNNKQTTIIQYDTKSGIMFYAEVGRNAVGCWNTALTFSQQSHGTVAKDDEKMIYPCDMNLDDQSDVWVLTNTMPVFLYKHLDENKYNFRIWKNSARKAVEGTICALPSFYSSRFGSDEEDLTTTETITDSTTIAEGVD